MFKYLNTLIKQNKLINKNFSKKEGFLSIFSFKKKNKNEEKENPINIDSLKFQNDQGDFQKLEKESNIPDKINYDNDLFTEIKEDLKTSQFKSSYEGTNIGKLIKEFGENIGENRSSIVTKINKLDYEKNILAVIERLYGLGFTNSQIRTIFHKDNFFLFFPDKITKMELFYKTLKDQLKFDKKDIIDILSCIPEITRMEEKNILNNIKTIRKYFSDEIIKEYPILITKSDNTEKVQFYMNLYLDITLEEYIELVKKFPLILMAIPHNVDDIFKIVDKFKFDRHEWKKLVLRDPKFLLFNSTQIHNIVKYLNSYEIKPKTTFEIFNQYPDLLISNRYSLLEKKLELLNDLNMKKSTVRNLIKRYPFILLKSYNSFIKKILYFYDLNIKIEETDIYPIIFVFDLERDIKPRCELMRKHNKWIPLKEAFSLSPEQFVERLALTKEEFNQFSFDSQLLERDVLFRYSKYLTF